MIQISIPKKLQTFQFPQDKCVFTSPSSDFFVLYLDSSSLFLPTEANNNTTQLVYMCNMFCSLHSLFITLFPGPRTIHNVHKIKFSLTMKTQNQCRMPVVTVKVHNNYIQKSFPKTQRQVQPVTKIIMMRDRERFSPLSDFQSISPVQRHRKPQL